MPGRYARCPIRKPAASRHRIVTMPDTLSVNSMPSVFSPLAKALLDGFSEAIVKTLDAHSWKLAETARYLGISRTTLWRRLKAYGLHRDGRSKWAQTS